MRSFLGEVLSGVELSEDATDAGLIAAYLVSDIGLRFPVLSEFEDEGDISVGELGEIGYAILCLICGDGLKVRHSGGCVSRHEPS